MTSLVYPALLSYINGKLTRCRGIIEPFANGSNTVVIRQYPKEGAEICAGDGGLYLTIDTLANKIECPLKVK